ncbi:hypothetical protein QAD02_006282 [Eretmocerus hayati]|uniref:Uncharacterized protein n=1 Tax=Eretmocerus hayati TaxID=131215 RepID=A0ACC2N4L9_9HYME|nr:hypothetical protein QAD02_006282 [Eretmocerus hayati]
MAHSTKFGVFTLLFVTIAAVSVTPGYSLSFTAEEADLHIKCALGIGPCNKDGLRVKAMIPVVMRGCEQCSFLERLYANQIVEYMKEYRPKVLELIKKKYRNSA